MVVYGKEMVWVVRMGRMGMLYKHVSGGKSISILAMSFLNVNASPALAMSFPPIIPPPTPAWSAQTGHHGTGYIKVVGSSFDRE